MLQFYHKIYTAKKFNNISGLDYWIKSIMVDITHKSTLSLNHFQKNRFLEYIPGAVRKIVSASCAQKISGLGIPNKVLLFTTGSHFDGSLLWAHLLVGRSVISHAPIGALVSLWARLSVFQIHFLRMGAGFQKPAKMGSVCIQKEPKKMHRERFYFDKIYKTRSGWTPLDKHARGQKFVNSPFKSLKCCEIYYSKPGFFPRKSVGNSYLKGHIVTQNNLINRSSLKKRVDLYIVFLYMVFF